MKYWTPADQKAIELYIKTDCIEERNKIFTQTLYGTILLLIRTALFKVGSCDDDSVSDLMEFVLTNVLPKIDETKVKATHHFLWLSITRKIISNHREVKSRKIQTMNCDSISELDYYNEAFVDQEIEQPEDLDEVRKEILAELDRKIIKQRVLNKTNTIFLILLKQYIIDNDFNVEHFREYAMETLNVSRSTYWNIASSVGIRSKITHSDKQTK